MARPVISWLVRLPSRMLLGCVLTLVPMPLIYGLISEKEPKPNLKSLRLMSDCKSPLSATLLVAPTENSNDVEITIFFDQWFQVRSGCTYFELQPPGVVETFQSFPYSELKYRGASPEEAAIGVVNLIDYSSEVKSSWHNGVNDNYFYMQNLEDFGGLLKFTWKNAVSQTSFVESQLNLQVFSSENKFRIPTPEDSKPGGDFVDAQDLKAVKVRLDIPVGSSLALGATAPSPVAYHRIYGTSEYSFELRDKTGTWETSSDLQAVFEGNIRKSMRDALLIIASAVLGLGLAIVSEESRRRNVP